jgi:hypothetical protein
MKKPNLTSCPIYRGKIIPTGYWKNESIQLLSGGLVVKPLQYRYHEFSIKSTWKNIKVSGQFRASGGVRNDIRIFIMNKIDYENMINGHPHNNIYDSGQITVDKIAVNLSSIDENYVLVYDNTFSTYSIKEVNGNIKLTYSYWESYQ